MLKRMTTDDLLTLSEFLRACYHHNIGFLLDATQEFAPSGEEWSMPERPFIETVNSSAELIWSDIEGIFEEINNRLAELRDACLNRATARCRSAEN
jgi:hypothetical protein